MFLHNALTKSECVGFQENLIQHVLSKMDELARSDNFGMQYQTYTQLLSDFEGYLAKQLPWFDLGSVRRKLRYKMLRQIKKQYVRRRRKHSTDLDASSDSCSESNSEAEDFVRGPVLVDLKEM